MIVIAILAVALFSVRPFCDVAYAAPAHGESAPALSQAWSLDDRHSHPAEIPASRCCASFEQGTLLTPADPLVSWTPGDVPGTVFPVTTAILRMAETRAATAISLAALPNRSYYARSARILR